MVVGTLVGLEIPLVMRILKRNIVLKNLVSQVLTFDYLGALAVSVAFPLILVPQLGMIRTGLLFGFMNAAVAVWALWLFRHELRRIGAHAVACFLALAALLAPSSGPTTSPRWPKTSSIRTASCSAPPRPTSASWSRAGSSGTASS
jgi:spermidine synthase